MMPDDVRKLYDQLKAQAAANSTGGMQAMYYGTFTDAKDQVMPPEEGDMVFYRGEMCPVVIVGQPDTGRMIIEWDQGWDPKKNTGAGRYIPADYQPEKNGHYYVIDTNDSDVDMRKTIKAKDRPKPKLKFDLAELDKLVVSDLVMSEIKAVLKQHDHSKKMFEEWGLGEVIKYGRGMTFLFYGPPGTGKTWAANCMAKVFGKDLMSIGAAEIQSSEPGGANRNIQQAFAEAKKSGKVLFLDECDSLITSRNDVGMILGGEINTLLTEIEKFEGVCILATNRIENLDEALERRISLIVEFPEPDYDQRVRIWDVLLPKKMPLDKKITSKLLAEWKLTGGQIKNVLLQAARLALAADQDKVGVEHFEAAVDRIIKSKSLMGNASRYRQIAVREDFKRGSGL